MRTKMKAKRPAQQKERDWTLPSICLAASLARGAGSCVASQPGQNFDNCIRNILSQQKVETCREHESRSREIQCQEKIWHGQVDPPIFAAKFESTREVIQCLFVFFVNSPVTYTMFLHIASWRAVLFAIPFLSFFRKVVRFESLEGLLHQANLENLWLYHQRVRRLASEELRCINIPNATSHLELLKERCILTCS